MKIRFLSNCIATFLLVPCILGYSKIIETKSSVGGMGNEDEIYNFETNYCGFNVSPLSDSETISYYSKSVEEYSFTGDIPSYSNDSSTGCANVAGAEIIAFYDKDYESLIPNFQVYIRLGTVLKYKSQTAEIEACMNELGDLMGTDSNGAGTSFSGFQTGMSLYVSKYGGLNYQSDNVCTAGNLNLSKFKSAINAGKPVALFMPAYTFQAITEGNGYDSIDSIYNTVAHVVAACGYRVDTYYDQSNRVIETRTYLKVASGLIKYGITYLSVDTSIFNEAISITIS